MPPITVRLLFKGNVVLKSSHVGGTPAIGACGAGGAGSSPGRVILPPLLDILDIAVPGRLGANPLLSCHRMPTVMPNVRARAVSLDNRKRASFSNESWVCIFRFSALNLCRSWR